MTLTLLAETWFLDVGFVIVIVYHLVAQTKLTWLDYVCGLIFWPVLAIAFFAMLVVGAGKRLPGFGR